MRRASGQLEESILELLGEHTELSVAQAREHLDSELAHTTVMTALVRLHGKGLVDRERRGRSFVYTLNAPVDEIPALRAAMRMRTELGARAERADVLASFVAALDPEDEATLRELLAKSDAAEQHP
ncbi:CopY family transcriptional regulator [Rhodococcus sp. 05-340-1]|uniref:BlaI/MecI/CopY family transcriptional regulator n=1 Tax=unclassified Rhodococcus (in: high G+C Gram-positive bacteria) TaxID=192944 RepID=UPI000B9B5DC8|nr:MULTISPECIES: BlaI/MecI/CopY family transcriptional regulator [unclassified Rhodococcus (in: high G+C Gram-positive bacteria)]OZD60469.1 CopY family transcriptional regulator [Rhodococcus sp. 05-340-2]OZD79202.1 CopY family transcriptional regulator [Rhodococcus sp. 05-340-1]OZF33639.1 CopY family transcriptional regulator [Rhodococcus sp. 14-2483-1-2]